jgi:dihydrofolate reductase
MRNIVYYVASSIDGYIARSDHSIEGFVSDSSAVINYFEDLKNFDTVIMGRRTYEFGYQFGLRPGQPAYPHMKHFIFSKSLKFDSSHDNVHVCPPDLGIIRKLKEGDGTDIYLCGGGDFAGWLLDNEQIDVLKIKLNPLILGEGIRLFGKSKKDFETELVESTVFDKGLQIITYKIKHPGNKIKF